MKKLMLIFVNFNKYIDYINENAFFKPTSAFVFIMLGVIKVVF